MPSPPDTSTTKRLNAGITYAAFRYGVRLRKPYTYGCEGRTLSAPTTDGKWLRLRSLPVDRWERDDWRGALEAEESVPAVVPRPALHRVDGWVQGSYGYRTELYERVDQEPVSEGPLLNAPPGLPDAWWASLRAALDSLSTVVTTRETVRQERLDWALPKFLRVALDTRVPAWATAHGDIQWSNVTGPELHILDWERWGRAPAGYDAALLFVSSLTEPTTAARVRQEFAHILDTPAGRFSQLVVASEYLQGMERGNNLELERPLRLLVGDLLVSQPPR